jgi:hypothetical protein
VWGDNTTADSRVVMVNDDTGEEFTFAECVETIKKFSTALYHQAGARFDKSKVYLSITVERAS